MLSMKVDVDAILATWFAPTIPKMVCVHVCGEDAFYILYGDIVFGQSTRGFFWAETGIDQEVMRDSFVFDLE
jgi:hypothetical protein